MRAEDGLFASPKYLAESGEPGHPRELSAFLFVGQSEAHTLLMVRPGAIGRFPVFQLARLATEPETMGAVVEGKGIGALSLSFALAQTHTGQLVRVLPDWEVLDPATVKAEIESLPDSMRMLPVPIIGP